MSNGRRAITTTGGREATTRIIPGDHALSVGMPETDAPEGWQWTKLTDLARLESGHTPSRKHPEYWQGEIPWISLTDARPYHGGIIDETTEHTNELGIANSSARVLPKGTVCLSRTASVGYIVLMGRDMATSQDFVNWVCADKLDNQFLKYLLLAESGAFRRFSSGSIHQTIYFPEVKAFHICHPGIAEQRRIVRILDEAFEGIANARANAEKNLQNARALFEGHLQSVFTQGGNGWQETRLGDVVERLTNGYVGPTRNIYVETGIPYLLARHVKNNRLAFDGKTHITKDFNNKNKKSILKLGDVLLVQSGHIGHSAVVPESHAGHNCHAMIVITPVKNAITGPFLSMYFNSPIMRQKFEGIRSGSTIPHLTCREVKELTISLPDTATQQRIVKFSQSLEHETRRLESLYQRKLAALDSLKKSLLHRAFTGQL